LVAQLAGYLQGKSFKKDIRLKGKLL